MKYYKKIALLLSLTWGFIGVQRIVIAIIMPAIQEDLKLDFTDVGAILSVTGLVWAFGTIIWAGIADHHGRRPIVAICTILASIFSWLTGFLNTVGQMMLVRGILGFFEGGPWGPAVATVSEETPPEKRGRWVALIPAGLPLIGMGLGPIIAVWLMSLWGSWRGVFFIISIPGFILGIILWFIMRETPSLAKSIEMRKQGEKRAVYDEHGQKVKMMDVLKYKNVLISTVISIPVMAWLWIFTGFSALWLTKAHGLSMGSMSVIIAASGVGTFLGNLSTGAVSDSMGRKKTLVIDAFLCFVAGLVIVLMPVGTSTGAFAALFFLWGGFGGGLYPLYLGTLPAESVPHQYAGTAIGVPTAVGEIIGAGVMPAVAGALADKFDLFAPIWMACVAGLVVMGLALFYVETAPRVVANMAKKPSREDHLLAPFRGKRAVALESTDTSTG
jgi:MFS family permease